MKKRILAVMLAAMLVFGMLAGCDSNSGGSDDSGPKTIDVVGTWALSSVEVEGETIDLEEFEETYGVGLSVTFTFAEDGNVTCNLYGIEMEGTYTAGETSVDVTLEEETETMNYVDGKLILADGEMSMVLSKK